jgi:hypothetical protein
MPESIFFTQRTQSAFGAAKYAKVLGCFFARTANTKSTEFVARLHHNQYIQAVFCKFLNKVGVFGLVADSTGGNLWPAGAVAETAQAFCVLCVLCGRRRRFAYFA